MPDLLLELFCEEIPARMQRKAAGDLKKRVTDALVENGLTYEGAREHWTPRRLTLDIRGVTARSADLTEERKGPRTDAPEKAVAGFLRGAGLASVDEAEVRSDPKKGDFYVAVIRTPGRDAEDIIAEVMPGIIRSFPWPKSMRWGAQSSEPGSLRWVRPLQSIMCTFGPETEEPVVIDFEVDGIRSANVTRGHRFHAGEPITVRRFEDYAAKLEKNFVILDAERRKEMIATDARNLAFANGIELVEDEGLLEEVAGLVEWPVVLMGEFEPDFLEIPDEVVRLTIKTNQKCFVCRGADAALTNKFILTANIAASDGGEEIARGNGKVVRARLSDALHFWRTDQANLPDLDKLEASAAKFELDLAKPLDQRMAKLDALNVTFHAKLGTQGERVARIAALAENIWDAIYPSLVQSASPHPEPVEGQGEAGSGAAAPVLRRAQDEGRQFVKRAAHLAKADLTTEIVGEFPEVQGAMGRTYASMQGEDASVALAIEDHYKPQGPSDAVPTDPVAITVALADKLDTLTGFWAIDEKPTGSKDPYALRRAALGVIRIVLENGIRLPLLAYGRKAGFLHETNPDGIAGPGHTATPDLLAFFHDRLKVYLRDKGARHDLIDAIVGDDDDDLLLVVRKVEALQKLLDSETGANLLAGTKRAMNILAAEEKTDGDGAFDRDIDPALLTEEAERELHAVLAKTTTEVGDDLARQDYEGAFGALAQLRPSVDAFFDTVMVNADDAATRVNRLALLSSLRATTRMLADFSRIEG